jgi:hypothetical protein
LPSLGIEVVYNAGGVGTKAAQAEAARRALKKMRQQKRSESPKRRSDPPGEGRQKYQYVPKQDANGIIAGSSDTISSPTALSYSSYQRSLEKRNNIKAFKDDATSLDSNVESETDENRPKHNTLKNKKNANPPTGSDVPTKEDLALKEAFNVFSTGNSTSTPNEEQSHGLSSASNPSTLTSFTNQKDKRGHSTVRFFPSEDVKEDFPDVLQSDDEDEESGDYISDEEEDEGSADAYPDRRVSSVDAQFDGSLSPKGGNIKVRLFSHGSNITEMYDLTELSEEDGKVVASSHSRNVSPHPQHKHCEVRHNFENGVDIPIEDDGHGHLVVNLSDVYEEDGPGSPLVYSPRSEGDNDPSLSPVERIDPYRSPDSRSPSTHKVLQDKKKKVHSMFPADLFQSYYDQREDDDILESPLNNRSSNDREIYSSPDVSYHFYDRQSSSYHRDPSFSKLEVANSYHSPISAQGLEPVSELDEHDCDKPSILHSRRSRPSMSPMCSTSSHSALCITSQRPKYGSQLTPALKKNPSHESRGLPRVSFSQDVEERFYRQENEGIAYQDSMSEVKSPLAAIIHEDRDLNEPLPSALSREADEAFKTLADKLGMEHDELRSSEVMLVDALSYGDPIPFDFEETLKRNPDLATGRLPEIDSYALHAACMRKFPERFGSEQKCRVKDLVDDIMLHQKLVGALVAANPYACMRIDRNGDLPAHIMARQLMEWEARWYQKVYEKAKSDNEDENGSGITKLYQTMSECINTLLEPVPQNPSLCLQPGSIGRLLPLHIAAIFTVSYTTLLSLLKAYPDAASIKCDLTSIRTFIPDRAVPLELHDRLSTDFPKWEIQQVDSDASEDVTQDILDKTYGTKKGMRRSDLMFAFYPELLPYRKDEARLLRWEKRITHELMENEQTGNFSLSMASKILWVWMCEFENPEDISDHYAGNIQRIIDSLPMKAVRYLASINNNDNRPIIDTVTSKSSDVIYERLKKIAETDIPVPVGSLNTGFNSTERSFILRKLDEDMASQFCLQGRGSVGPLCRKLFNIAETAFPTSFVLLPYKLIKDEHGRLGLDSAKAAKIAMKFADSLLKLTSPTTIIHVLDRKSVRFGGQGLVSEENFDWWSLQPKQKELLSRFLNIYGKGPAYFYFIDEYTGVPIVNDDGATYPLEIHEAEDVVRKVFPLMLTGMILMRGEKAITILANVLLDKNVSFVKTHWIDTAKDLVAYLFSPQIEWTKTASHELFPTRDKLLSFICEGPSKKQVNSDTHDALSSEWVVESSLMKMIVEMHDTHHNYAGLCARRSGFQVMWTLEPEFLNPESNEYLMQIDIMSIQELKRISKRQQKSLSEFGSPVFDDSTSSKTGYDVLFGDLAMVETKQDSDNSKDDVKTEPAKRQPTVVKMTSSREHRFPQFPVRSHHAPNIASLLEFDDSLDLDDVLKLRIQLDEQEAKLEFLREKIEDLEDAEKELLEQEDRISEMINEIIHSKENILESPSKAGLSKARMLLLRICDLEERVLCGEVEVGQLRNKITLFEMEAAAATEIPVAVYSSDEQSEDDSDESHESSYRDFDEDSTLDSFMGGKAGSTFQHITPQNYMHL